MLMPLDERGEKTDRAKADTVVYDDDVDYDDNNGCGGGDCSCDRSCGNMRAGLIQASGDK